MRTDRLTLATAIAAALVAGCAVSGDVDRPSNPAGQAESPPLQLQLSAERTCETTIGSWAIGSFLIEDEHGDEQWVSLTAWGGVSDTPVIWRVNGGQAPYKLSIDGESRDGQGWYQGASGSGLVSCALEHGDTIFSPGETPRRKYLTQPLVDSGWKTIEAQVTDASGATANASADIYILRRAEGTGEHLTAGETYLIHGHLITIPIGQDAVIGDSSISHGQGGEFSIYYRGFNYYAAISIRTSTGEPLGNGGIRWIDDEEFAETRAGAVAVPSSEYTGELNQGEYLLEDEAEIYARLAALADSIGEPPRPRSD